MIDAEDAMPVLLIIWLFILIIWLFISLAAVGQGDYEQEKIEAAHYCEMRALWEKDSAAGDGDAGESDMQAWTQHAQRY